MTINDEPVTHCECEQYRSELRDDNKRQDNIINTHSVQIAQSATNIEHLLKQNAWFMGIVASILASLIVYLITHN